MPRDRREAFTLVELMVVIGLISMLVSLMLPALGKMRAAAQSTVCMSNLRTMGQAWTMYTSESRGKLMPYVWQTPATPEASWNGYWLGVIESKGGVSGPAVICPSASEISQNAPARGYGDVKTAWTGRYTATGTAISFTPSLYRESSYGFNRYLTAGGGFGADGKATSVAVINNLSVVPLFFDCAFADVRPENGSEAEPAEPPPDLRGSTLRPGRPEHWKVLLARHGKGINVCMADGHVKWVPLEDLYQMTWRADWRKYRLNLP